MLTVLAQVPAGTVVAFGDLATMSGYPGRARWVGTVLSKLPSGTKLPWHRVVNSQGTLTCPRAELAAKRLAREGIPVHHLKVSMLKHRWSPERSTSKVAGPEED
ncbi:MAG: MGMT family protein [Luminiphilus sp.]|nr:MGMT family protein [Luminiphilus sp.]MDG1066176.1 MGMT family protein [Luminiphilus sp.]